MKVLDHGFVELIDSMPALSSSERWSDSWGPGDQRVVDAARVSISGREVRPVSDDAKLLRYLLANRHTSPLEKVRFEFHCKMPVFVARQWIRHRMGSFNEQSARYGVLGDEFYIPGPERMARQSASNKQGSGALLDGEVSDEIIDAIEKVSKFSYKVYEGMLSRGLARELARIILPVNIYTQWWWTVDLHNLLHFLRLRLHEHAQYEIRVYGEAIVELIRPIAPMTVRLFEESIDA